MAKNTRKVTIGQVGLGKWGKNLLRNFFSLSDCTVKYACDINPAQLTGVSKEHPSIRLTSELNELLDDNEIEGVVVATPASFHYSVAKRCLNKGKNVFVEKPITLRVGEAEDLVEVARKADKKLMVGHLLLYHPAIVKLKEMIEAGALGKIYYIYTQRLNLGTIRNTENVVWSLAPHDISIILHLMGGLPQSLSALGASFVQKGIEDVAFLNIRFASGEIGHVHVSWLDPTKSRKTIVVGSKKMAIFDEITSRETLTLIDKGVDINPEYKTFEEFLRLRFGAEQPVAVSSEEPLKLECRHFIDCIRQGKTPLSDGTNGVNVLKVLAAAERSLKKRGRNELL